MAKPNWKTYKHPPIEDPAGHNGGGGGAPIQPAPPCGGSQSPLLHKELYTLSTQTAACLLACLLGRQGKITRLHTQKSLLKTAPQEMSVCIWTHLGLDFRSWNWSLRLINSSGPKQELNFSWLPLHTFSSSTRDVNRNYTFVNPFESDRAKFLKSILIMILRPPRKSFWENWLWNWSICPRNGMLKST